MPGGVNDSPEDARRVVRLLANLKSVKVNLIPWNPGELPYRESSADDIEAFRNPGRPRHPRLRPLLPGATNGRRGQLALLNIAPANATPPRRNRKDSTRRRRSLLFRSNPNHRHHSARLRSFFSITEQKVRRHPVHKSLAKIFFAARPGFQLRAIRLPQIQQHFLRRRLMPRGIMFIHCSGFVRRP